MATQDLIDSSGALFLIVKAMEPLTNFRLGSDIRKFSFENN